MTAAKPKKHILVYIHFEHFHCKPKEVHSNMLWFAGQEPYDFEFVDDSFEVYFAPSTTKEMNDLKKVFDARNLNYREFIPGPSVWS